MNLTPHNFASAKTRVDVSYRRLDNPEAPAVKLTNVLVSDQTPFKDDVLTIRCDMQRHGKGDDQLYSVHVKANIAIELVQFEVKYLADIQTKRMLANGFQSWSQAREMDKDDRIPAIRSSVAWYTQLNLQGDYDFFAHSGEKGHIHSSSYTHFRDVTNNIQFFGSLSEHLGYTYFKGDFNNNVFSIYKDVLGKSVKQGEELELVKIFMAEGKDAESAIWDRYASFFPDRRALKGDNNQHRHVNGWTSWYNYYGDVSEDIVIRNLEALQRFNYSINVFQIDDGFQTAIGDWLSINHKFPSGMKAIAQRIKEAGFTPGLWLAPYAVGFHSRLAKEHPDWLIKEAGSDKPVVAGPNWGGFYALDMYHPQAREYLKTVFHTVLHEWGFDMLKLDFCFAAAMIPRLGKSRGEIMWDAMEFIRDLVGPEKLILGCGVPLASAWRKVDYCRIGSDVAPWWEDTKLKMLHVRERVSTANSLVSTLTRWTMSDRMFGNDPDVMILRTHKNKLTADERYTLCLLNNILGALVFISDNVAEYGKDEHLLYSATFPKVMAQVSSVIEFRSDVFVIQFRYGDQMYTTFANLSSDEQTIYLPSSSESTHLLFATDNDMHMTIPDQRESLFYHPSSTVTLKRHESKTFLHIPRPQEGKLAFLGSVSHIIPGAEVSELSQASDRDVKVTFHKDSKRNHRGFVAIGEYLFEKRVPTPSQININGAAARFEWISVGGSGEGRSPSEVLVAVFE